MLFVACCKFPDAFGNVKSSLILSSRMWKGDDLKHHHKPVFPQLLSRLCYFAILTKRYFENLKGQNFQLALEVLLGSRRRSDLESFWHDTGSWLFKDNFRSLKRPRESLFVSDEEVIGDFTCTRICCLRLLLSVSLVEIGLRMNTFFHHTSGAQ